jgi:hypothetical protein
MVVQPIVVIAVVALAVLLLVAPFVWGLLASWINPTSAKGAYQKKAVTKLLTLKESLVEQGHPAASKLCRDTVIALICDETEEPQAQPQKKSLLG